MRTSLLVSNAPPRIKRWASSLRQRKTNSCPSSEWQSLQQGEFVSARPTSPLPTSSLQRLSCFCGLLMLLMGLSNAAHAVDRTWVGATGGTWNTATNWSPNGVPTTADALTILGPSNAAGALTINIPAASQAGSINFTNTAATTLNNTTSGATQTLTLGSATANGITTSTGAVLIGSTTANQGVNVALGADQTWNVGTGGLQFSNIISGAFGITKSTGLGVLSLGQGNGTTTNTFTGGFTLNAGEVQAFNASGTGTFGTGTLTVNGGTITSRLGGRTISNAVNVGGDFTLNGPTAGGNALNLSGTVNLGGSTRTITTEATGVVTISGVISNGGLTKAGSNSLTLSGANTYAGPTTVNSATLIATNATSLGTTAAGTTVASGAALDIRAAIGAEAVSAGGTGIGGAGALLTSTGTGSLSGAVTLTSNANIGGAGALTLSGPIGGSASVTKVGAGATTLSGTSTYSGGTTVSLGTLVAGSNQALGTGAVSVSNAAAQLQLTNGVDVGNALTIVGGAASGTANQGVLFFSSATGSATYSGPITINAATNAGGHFASSGGALNLTGVITSAAPITSRNGLVVVSNTGSSYTALNITGGTLRLGATNAVPVGTTIDIGASGGATFDLGGFNQTLVGVTRAVANGAVVTNSGATTSTLTTTGTSTFPGIIQNGAGTTALTVGGGTLTLSGVNTYTGDTTLSTGGTLALGASNVIADTSNVVLGGGTFSTGAFSEGSVAGSTVTPGLGQLSSTAASTINYGAGGNILAFSGAGTLGGLITVTGYTFGPDRLFVGTQLGAQLAQVKFVINSTTYDAQQDPSTGELTPILPLTTLYWTGATSNSWNVATNWSSTPDGTGPGAIPDTLSNVVFSATNAQNLPTTTLDAPFTIRSLTFSATSPAVNITSGSGTNSLTIGAPGITVEAGAGAPTISTAGGVILGTDQTWTNNATVPLTVSAPISGAFVLSTAGTGTTVLSGTNTDFNAAVNAGTLLIQGGAAIPDTSTVTTAVGATFDVTASETIGSLTGAGGTVLIETGTTLTTGTAAASTFGGAFSGTGGLTKVGTGTFTLTGSSPAFTGITTISAGALQLGNGTLDGSLSSSAGIVDNGTLIYNRSTGSTFTYANNISGTGNVTKTGPGTQILSGNNSYGNTSVTGGFLTAASNTAFGTGTVTGVTREGAINLTGGITLANNFVTSNDGSGATPYSIANLSGNNTITGTISLTTGGGGTAIQSDSGNLNLTGNITISITNSARPLILQGASTGTISGVISNGTGTSLLSIIKNGAGTWTLSGNNTYTSTTTVNAGTLRAGVATVGTTSGAFGVGSAVTLANVANTTLDLNGFSNSVGSLAGGGTTGGNVTLGSATLTTGSDNTTPLVFGGIISGNGGFTKVGTGVLTLTGDSTYTGGTTISAGTLAVAATGGTTGSIVGNVTNNATLLFNRSNDYTFEGVISGTGLVQKAGTGTGLGVNATGANASVLTLAGANTFTGNVNVSNGGIRITNSNGLGTGTKTINLNSGTTGNPSLRLDGTTGAITLPGTFSYNTSNGSLADSAFTILNVAGNNTLAGTMTMTVGGGGTIVQSNAGSLNISANVTANTTGRILILQGASGGTVSGVISNGSAANTVGLNKLGSGTWTLSNTNTYSVATTVGAGTLSVTGTTGTSEVTVASGATLNGTGTSSGGVVVASGGTHAPGLAGPGIQNTGNYNTGGSLLVDVAGATAGTGYDQVNVTGTVTVTGSTLNLSSPGFTPTTGDVLVVVNNDDTDAVTGTFAGLPEGSAVTVGGSTYTISYVGGTGNDITLTPLFAAPSGILISEFRTSGPGGSADEYVELTNTTTGLLNISNWTVRYTTGAGPTTTTIPGGTTIPAGGHYLLAGSAYGLSSYAASDQALSGDITQDTLVSVFNASGTEVDNTTTASTSTTAQTSEYAWVRPNTSTGTTTFSLVAVDAANGAQLGAPGPQNLTSAVATSGGGITYSLVYPSAASDAAPNRTRSTSVASRTAVTNATGEATNFGTMQLRRSITNNTGRTITGFRVRVVNITSLNSPGYSNSAQADLRLMTSSDVNILYFVGDSPHLVQGVTVQTPPNQPRGAALNSSATMPSVTLAQPLLAGQTGNYNFMYGVIRDGSFSVTLIFEPVYATP